MADGNVHRYQAERLAAAAILRFPIQHVAPHRNLQKGVQLHAPCAQIIEFTGHPESIEVAMSRFQREAAASNTFQGKMTALDRLFDALQRIQSR